MVVVAHEVVALNVPYDAIVDDVKDSGFVKHLEHIFVF